ncbi:uncharacterized protein LOC119167178 [Rhipicephalus microplus]|uniref:uncharacterized protein LOC119167178 n=1 Tax=Rhipicephalus microplus TaxID=6941 RepID=UPI003F6CE84E
MRIILIPLLAYQQVIFFVPVDAKGGISDCYSMPNEDDECEAEVNRWYYNRDEKKCVNFMYGECARGSNNFDSDDACMQACKNAGGGPVTPQRPVWPPKGPTKGPSKGHPPWNKKPRPPGKGPQDENETGSGGWPTKGQVSGGWKPQKRPQRPHWPPRRPPKKWPAPPSKKPGHGHCGARMRKNKGCDYEGMWFNNAPFVTCSRVRKGGCPTVGAFFASCEECMGACYRHRIKQCQYMT